MPFLCAKMPPAPKCSGITCSAVALHECARCHSVAYCSADCQRADWPLHKPHCRAPSAEAQSLVAAVQSILGKWAAQGTFTRYLDGNRQNAGAGNAVPAGLRECLKPANLAAWCVDWDANLSREEVELVRNPSLCAALLLAQLPGDAPREEAAAAGAASGGGSSAGVGSSGHVADADGVD